MRPDTRFGIEEGTKHHEDQERALGLSIKAVDALRTHRGAALKFPGDPIFRNSRGARLSYHAAYARFVALRQSAGLDDFKPHDLRHLSLTIYGQGGATMADLMARGGHTDHRSVLTYQHASKARDRELVDAMEL